MAKMTLAQIKERAAMQFNMDAEDVAELDPNLTDYVNEGYINAVQQVWRPWREETLMAADQAIPFTAFASKPIELLTVDAFGQPATLDELNACVRVLGAKDGDPVTVRYRYLVRALEENEDEPKLPDWTHGALADWATWSLYTNGNPQKQNRGLYYRQRYDDVMKRLRPFGETLLTERKFRNLYIER